MFFSEIGTIIFLIISSICAVSDTAKRHIDNRVLLSGLIAVIIAFTAKAPHVELRALMLMLLFICVLFFTFTMRLMGGGDVKLYAFLAFSIPNGKGFNIMVLSMILAAAYGAICLMITNIFFVNKDSKAAAHSIPMALFIFMAALVFGIWEGGVRWIE